MAAYEEAFVATDRAVSELAATLCCPLLDYTSSNTTTLRPNPQRHLYPTGPYALHLWHPGDDINLVCITDNSASTFWSYVAEKLDRENLPHHDCPIVELEHGGEVWLHYCSLLPGFELRAVPGYGFPRFVDRVVPSYVTRNQEMLQDTWHVLQSVGGFQSAFCQAYNDLWKWAESAGLYSAACGTMDAEALLWMLFNACTPDEQAEPDSDALNESFFSKYQSPESLKNIRTPSGRNVFNPPHHLAPDSRAILATQVLLAHRNLTHAWPSHAEQFEDFISSYSATALVTAECWAPKKRAEFTSQLVTQIPRLPKALHDQNLTHSAVRIWPYPFRLSEEEWLYLVGIEETRPDNLGAGGTFAGSASRTGAPEEDQSESATFQPRQELVDLLETFPFTLDPKTGRATAHLCAPKEPAELQQMYGAPRPTFCGILSDNTSPPKPPPLRASSQTKFPPVHHILSRLRWDPYYSSQSFSIGYLDRFEGLKWLPLESWGKAIEEEDFVPEHRIRVVKNLLDGRVVWDRERRWCGL